MMSYTSLLHYCIRRVSGFYSAINGDIPSAYRALPDIMVAPTVSDERTPVGVTLPKDYQENACDFR